MTSNTLPGRVIDDLNDSFDVEIFDKEDLPTKSEIIKGAKDACAIISTVSNRIDKEIIGNCPDLMIIANYGVGFENIDVSYATKQGIFVTNTPDVLTETTADLAWALMFAVARRVVEGDKVVRGGEFKRWGPNFLLGLDVHGKILGIYGMGRIGTAVARRSIGFGMRVIYHSRGRSIHAEEEIGCIFVDFNNLLKESDFLVITVPLSDATLGRFGLGEFKSMKNDSILVNISRGPIVKENELAVALEKGFIWGAGLDVYEREPEVEKRLLNMNNVVLLPHVGSASLETRVNMSEMAVANVVSALSGEVPKNLVNPEVLKFRE